MVTKPSFNIPEFDCLVSGGGHQKLRSSHRRINSRPRSPCGSLRTRRFILTLLQIQRPNTGRDESHCRYGMIVSPQRPHALILLNIPYFNAQIGRRARQISPLGTEIHTRHDVGMSLERAQILPRFVIPEFDRPVLAPARGHGVNGMQRHGRHHRRVTLEGVSRGRTGEHPPLSAGHAAAGIGAPSTVVAAAVRVYFGIGCHLPFEFQDATLETGYGRPFLFEDGCRRGGGGGSFSVVGGAGDGIGLG
mmetsp:Transcript_4255/g.9328  ORF Transcript_4255/g.9328 Transcript_4255/m.9328 type:complete len:248 (+) Transcript_4255:769-1512(+)